MIVKKPYCLLLAAGLLSCMVLAIGCQKKEKVLKISTPNGELEIERSTETGKVDIEITRDKNK